MQNIRGKLINRGGLRFLDTPIKLMLVVPSLFQGGICKVLESEKDIEIVAEASTHIDTVSFIEQKKPDVLFIDTFIPDIDILEILELIRQKSPETKLLLLVNALDEEAFINAVSLGVQGYLTEASDTEQFIEAVRAVGKEEIWAERRIVTKVLTQLLPLRRDKLHSNAI
jgi:DNA-binding NarL/FixJ family response regulator